MSLFPTAKMLPAEDIIGRDSFIHDATRRTIEHQSVTVPGPRGIGKTAVATEVLRRCREAGAITASAEWFLQSTPEEFAEKLITAILANQDSSRVRAVVNESLAAIRRWLQGPELAVRLYRQRPVRGEEQAFPMFL